MGDYISRELVREVMYHNQEPLTEYQLDEIPTADVVDRIALRDALYDADAIMMEGVKIINQFPTAGVAEIRPELRKAFKLLEKNFERGFNSDYVRDPLAWALYQTWKEIDGGAK